MMLMMMMMPRMMMMVMMGADDDDDDDDEGNNDYQQPAVVGGGDSGNHCCLHHHDHGDRDDAGDLEDCGQDIDHGVTLCLPRTGASQAPLQRDCVICNWWFCGLCFANAICEVIGGSGGSLDGMHAALNNHLLLRALHVCVNVCKMSVYVRVVFSLARAYRDTSPV